MINFDNSVTNIANTPGIISAPTSEAPVASTLAPGTIWINTTTGVISQSNGSTFSTIGGGGGSTPGIDSVLAINQSLTDYREIDINANGLVIKSNLDYLATFYTNVVQLSLVSVGSIRLQNVSSNNVFETFISTKKYNDWTGLKVFANPTTDDGIKVSLGDYANANHGVKLLINDNDYTIQTKDDSNLISGFYINQSVRSYQFGREDNFLQIYAGTGEMRTYLANNKQGFEFLTGNYYVIGDYDGKYNGTIVNVIDSATTIEMVAPTVIQFTTDQLSFTGSLTATGSYSPGTNPHLMVTINGTQYYIQLLT